MTTNSELDTPLPYHPAAVETWSGFGNKVASHIADLNGRSERYPPIAPPVTKVEILGQACYCFSASVEVHSVIAADAFT